MFGTPIGRPRADPEHEGRKAARSAGPRVSGRVIGPAVDVSRGTAVRWMRVPHPGGLARSQGSP